MEFGWLFMVGLPTFMYAITNHIDKHLLEGHFKCDDGVATLVLISSLVSVVGIPFILLFGSGEVIPDNAKHLAVFLLLGLLHTALLWFYLTALNEEDTTTIIVFYSILPVLGLLLSNLFLDEVLFPMQFVAMAIIIVAILAVSFERNGDHGYRIRWRPAMLMFMASFCWALGDTVFKAVAIEENVWRTLFWEHVVMFSIGVFMFTLAPKLRKQISLVLRENSTRIISINLTNEVLYIVANVMSALPLMMVQVAAVHLVQASQPVWVFLIALFLIYTGVTKERFTKAQLLQKGIATILAVIGMFFLELYTPTA